MANTRKYKIKRSYGLIQLAVLLPLGYLVYTKQFLAIIIGLTLLPIIVMYLLLEPYLIISNEKILKHTKGGRIESPELQISIKDIKKIIIKENRIRIFTNEYIEYSHLFRLETVSDVNEFKRWLLEYNDKIEVQ